MRREGQGAVLSQIGTLLHIGTATGLTDGQLLERFTTRGGEASEVAFAALVERHGPMVLRVCRGVLNHPQDTQDAFQATFLVLVRQAASIRERASLASWLYGVAYRVALYARAAAIRRTSHERRAAERSVGHASHETPGDDLAEMVHEEVAGLPECYRAVIVLCDLEGLTHEQAAGQLACPVGTVKSRLARGRGRLRTRLTRRGLAPAVGSILWAREGLAAVPLALGDSTVRAAMGFAAGKGSAGTVPASVVALTGKVLWSMLMNRVKMVAIATLLGIAVTGAGTLAFPAQEPQSKEGPVPEKKSHSKIGGLSGPKATDGGGQAMRRSIGEELEAEGEVEELADIHAQAVLSQYAVEMAEEEIQVWMDLLRLYRFGAMPLEEGLQPDENKRALEELAKERIQEECTKAKGRISELLNAVAEGRKKLLMTKLTMAALDDKLPEWARGTAVMLDDLPRLKGGRPGHDPTKQPPPLQTPINEQLGSPKRAPGR